MKWSTVSSNGLLVVVLCFCEVALGADEQPSANRVFRAAAAAVDITPTQFPVIVNGQFQLRPMRGRDSMMALARLAL